MKRTLLHISITLIAALCSLSCVREALPGGDREGVEVLATLDFAPQDNLEISTKATLSGIAEYRVLNLFVFLFDKDGNKLYSQYFDSSNKQSVTSTSALSGEGWWVTNSNASSVGGVRIKASSGSGYKIYAMANLDADMVRVSSDLLSHNINNEADLKAFSVYLNQEIVSRNGYFPMTGVLSGLTISSTGAITKDDGSAAGTLMLSRLDAKIKFVFKTGSRIDAKGQKIKSFTAKQWKVVNAPATAYLVKQDSDSGNVDPATTTDKYVDYAPKFFDTGWTNFEEFPDDNTSSFSFYMLENRQTPKNAAGITSYQDRSRQVKQSEGYHPGENETVTVSYVNSRGKDVTRDMRVFQNANDFSTYVLVTGRVEMDLDEDESAGQVLGGDVQYLIHLGDWSFTEGDSWDKDTYGSFKNFNTERNTFYTYTVTVNSVDNIRVEVETSTTENQPGATGQVTIAKEEIAICDAHYYSKTMTFHASNLFEGYNGVADDLTWRVKTPFSEGEPESAENPGALDYKWVHFRLNKRDSDGTYSEKRRKFVDPSRKFETSTTERSASDNKEGDGTDGLAGYHNDGLMDIIDLVKYIKKQVSILEEWRKNPGMTYEGDFDNVSDPKDISNAKICVTAFVDEYYYDENPVTGVSSPTLWKSFVNQPDRSLHILCNSNASKDLESRTTGSVITIQQHAIQTIYNTDESDTSLQSAWGVEYVDEFTDKVTTYNANSSTYTGSKSNTSQSNGLYNSVQEWGLSDTTNWSKYMDFETANDLPQMQSGYAALRYICLSRNRDNNGDGVIAPDELRWYTASIRQLIGLYVGNGVIDHHSRLYYRSANDQTKDDPNVWRQHVISSTRYNNVGEPIVVWGEEGISTGNISGSKEWGGGLNKFSVRCVRNLGLSNPTSINLSESDYVPDDYVEVETEGSGNDAVYTFKCTHINDAALRYYTSRELDYHSNTSDINRLYKRFEVCSVNQGKKASKGETYSGSFEGINKDLSDNINKGQANPYCPTGYRLPNQIEMAMMAFYTPSLGVTLSRTYWALGSAREDGVEAKEKKYGYTYDNNINLGEANKSHDFVPRCVRDIRTD